MNSDELDSRITDLLHQIGRLNDQIEMHRKVSGDNSAISQYEYMRDDFIAQVNETLATYRLQVIQKTLV
ncbi:MAG TPA: hypothetical protein VGA96_13995 [Fibrella sp.]